MFLLTSTKAKAFDQHIIVLLLVCDVKIDFLLFVIGFWYLWLVCDICAWSAKFVIFFIGLWYLSLVCDICVFFIGLWYFYWFVILFYWIVIFFIGLWYDKVCTHPHPLPTQRPAPLVHVDSYFLWITYM